MPPQSAVVLYRKVVACAFVLFFIAIVESSDEPQVGCSKTCVAENCNSMRIRYGKYCGLGWSGCPGEKPCDDLDACCKIHDGCVGKKGMTNVKCHVKFVMCIKKVHKSRNKGFSKSCSYDTAVPTMVQGMNMAIMFNQLEGDADRTAEGYLESRGQRYPQVVGRASKGSKGRNF